MLDVSPRKVTVHRMRGSYGVRKHVFVSAVLLTTLLCASPAVAYFPPDPHTGRAALPQIDSVADLPGMSMVSVHSPVYYLHLEVSLAREAMQVADLAKSQAESLLSAEEGMLHDAMFQVTAAQAKADHAGKISRQWSLDLLISQESLDRGMVDMLAFSPRDPSAAQDLSLWAEQIGEYRQAQYASLTGSVGIYVSLVTAAQNRYETAKNSLSQTVAALSTAVQAVAKAQENLDTILGQKMSYQTVVSPDGCPVEVPYGTLREYDGTVWGLCARSVALAATPEAALAIKYAFRALGSDYACDAVSRHGAFSYDCSSLVARSYGTGAGLPILDSMLTFSTRNMVPWGGGEMVSWLTPVSPAEALPGDVVLYDTFKVDTRHSVIMLADGMMLHTDSCGDVAHIRKFWGFENSHYYDYLGSRRVVS